jgi:glyoxylase-like metal-dependent hydrolase (beta-lactamase superfamily II)
LRRTLASGLAAKYTAGVYPQADVIVIGHLSRNPFWGEEKAVRLPVATTTLIRAGDRRILVDPSLPGEILVRMLHERSGLTPDKIDSVLLTSFYPTHRRGLAAFDDARWLIGPAERSAVQDHLRELLGKEEKSATIKAIEEELEILNRTEPADDVVAEGVQLFPSVGVTPGLCGLLIEGLQTTIVAGDAVLTREHFEQGLVFDSAVDPDAARQSLQEIYDIADLVIPGHDNVFVARPSL